MEKGMELNYFKDTIFDMMNNSDEMDIKDIKTNDKENKFTISFMDGTNFELECRQINENL